VVTKEDIDRLRLKTGQVVTEEWFDELGDVLDGLSSKGAVTHDGYVTKTLIPYEYVNLGDELSHFKQAYIDELYSDEINANDVNVSRNLTTETLQADQINAETGNFNIDLFVNGKKVIKDEDPIYIQQFLSPADYQLYEKNFEAMKYAILELEPLLVEKYVSMVKIVETKTPLGASEEFNSGWIHCEGFDAITGTILSDTDGTLYVEQSGDGTESDYAEILSVSANKRFGFKFELLAEHVRVRFVNSATAQSKFRLFVYKKR